MTKQESFKRRVRARMAKTGEKYGAARRVLLDQAARAQPCGRVWSSQPEVGDEAVRETTGRGWDAWCDVIEAWPGHVDGHAPVAAWLQTEQNVSGWWAQTITGGWERITGRRLPGQMPDGTFTANKTATISIDADLLRRLLLDNDDRADLFPGRVPELRSKATSKSIRLGFGDSVAMISLHEKQPGRVAVNVQHSKITTTDAIDEWKFWWAEWLAAIDESSAGD